MYIVLAILAFGIIIAIHELGHFFAAKALNVKVNELAIGMGPKLFSKQGAETLYSLRLVPFGGFCSMEGEYGERLERDDSDSDVGKDIAFTNYVLADGANVNPDELRRAEPERFEPELERDGPGVKPDADPRSFNAQKRRRRAVILVAGSLANFVAAFIIIFILSLGADGYGSTTLANVTDRLPEQGQSEIMSGDKIVRINGERLYYYNDYALFMSIYADKPITLTLQRGDNLFEYHSRPYIIDGVPVYRYTLSFDVIEPSLWEGLKYSGYQTFNFVRMIRVSISMMFAGTASVREVAGPVGIVSAMNTVGRESPTIGAGIVNIVYLTAFIGVNVAALNMLPIPAMDGGRVLFIAVTYVIEKFTRKELDPKYENYINTGAFMILIGLMVIIMYNDIMRILG